MMFSKPKFLQALGLALVILAGCTAPQPSSTPTALPTTSPRPTPTPTPQPSPTPSPEEAYREANRLLEQSDFAGAIAAYQRAIDIDPGYSPAYAGLSQAYYWEHLDYAASLANAEKAVELAPQSAEAHAALAQAQSFNDAVTDALQSAQKAAGLDAQSAAVQAVLAQANLENNQFEEARLAAEQAYALDPASAQALAVLGQYYERTADFGRARAAYEQAASLAPEFVPWQVMLGGFYNTSERHQEASQALERAIELAPENVIALLLQVYVEVDRKQFETARTMLEKAEQLAPGRAPVYLARSYLSMGEGEYDQALEQLEKALDLDPQSVFARMAKAQVLLMQRECEQSRELFQEVAGEHPEQAIARGGVGSAELCAGDVNKALSHFRQAAKDDPYNPSFSFGIGLGYFLQQRWDDARDGYLEALRLDPAPASLHAAMGDYYWSQQLTEQAEAEYRLAQGLNPYLLANYLALAGLMMEQDRLEEASEIVEQAAALDTSDPNAQRLLGILANLQGQPEAAVERLQRSLEKDAENPHTHLHLGLAYRDLGKYRQASTEIQSYQALMGDGLPEEEAFRIDFLLSMLNSGYLVDEEKALSDMEELTQLVVGKRLDLKIEGAEPISRTLVVDLPLSAEEAAGGAYMNQVGALTGLFSMFVPRIDPKVENGVEMRLTRPGQPPMLVRMDLSTLKQFADTILPAEQLGKKFDFELAEQPGSRISIAQIARQIAGQRQLELKQTPPSETITPAGVQEHLESSVDEQARASLGRDDRLLTLLGVISPSADLEEILVDLYSEQIAGFYSPEEAKIYLVDQGQPAAGDRVVIAHETAHALQDQAFGLEMLSDETMNDDQRMAVEALVEGDASLAMVNYMQENIPQIELLEVASNAGSLQTEALEAAPDFIGGMANFPYISGIAFVQALFDRGGWEAVDQAYGELPQSTEQILHPERYQEKDAPVKVDLPDLAQTLGEGWQEVDRDVMGEYALRLVLEGYFGPLAAEQAMEGWGGDAYVLAENTGDRGAAFALKTTWDDDEQALEFWELFRSAMYHRPEYIEVVEQLVGELDVRLWQSEANAAIAARDGKDVVLLVGPDLETLKPVLEAMR